MRISDWSSDVCSADLRRVRWGVRFVMIGLVPDHLARPQHAAILNDSAARGENGDYIGDEGPRRSEEHTSELQSLMRISYAVFCLKKKTIKRQNNIQHKRTKQPRHKRQQSTMYNSISKYEVK